MYAADQQFPSEYRIQVYSADGSLLSEYLVSARKYRLADIGDAEWYVRHTLEASKFGTTVVIVSSEVPEALDQVHIEVAANDPA